MKKNDRLKILLHTLGIALVSWLISCSSSPPAAPSSSKNPPSMILKFVAYSQDNALMGYFSLADSATNQIAASGRLKLHLYTSTRLTIGSSSGDTQEGVPVKTTLYDNTFAIGVTNFHWETVGSIFVVKDLALRFAIPYSSLKTQVQRGRVATIVMEFTPDHAQRPLSAIQNVSLY